MSIKKQYLKNKSICKVTFRLQLEGINKAKSVHLVGDFNQWNSKLNPMTRLKDGSFKTVIELATGQEYQFRYLLNNDTWENDSEADNYLPNPFGNADNSVIVV
jgi:1,4-alpha-glucan branching enzyme